MKNRDFVVLGLYGLILVVRVMHGGRLQAAWAALQATPQAANSTSSTPVSGSPPPGGTNPLPTNQNQSAPPFIGPVIQGQQQPVSIGPYHAQ